MDSRINLSLERTTWAGEASVTATGTARYVIPLSLPPGTNGLAPALAVAYDSRAAMERSRDQADYLRGISTAEVDVEFLDVTEFELAVAHLHVPELV